MLRTTRLLLLIAATALSAAAEPNYPCFRVEQAPAIDGVVRGDDTWAAVPAVTGFEALGGGYTEAKQSFAYACHDAEGLYVAVVFEEPDIDQVSSVMSDGDGLWLEDSLELFVEPVRAGPVYQFVVSAGGAKTGAKAAADVTGWRVAVRRGDGSYSVELALPWSVFHAGPGEGWHIAFCRNIFTCASGGDKFTSWPRLISQYHEPESYARLELLDAPASPERRDAAERALNADYRAHLMAQVRALVPAGEQYMPTLRQAAADDASRLQGEAREAVMTWRGVRRTADEAEEAPIRRLREAATRARALRQQAYELTYRYLLDGLFEDR